MEKKKKNIAEKKKKKTLEINFIFFLYFGMMLEYIKQHIVNLHLSVADFFIVAVSIIFLYCKFFKFKDMIY